ncbi:MAG: helix-turn-helix transcriptional regulator [Acetobacteraceae bacterium]|nr:helix-turn-helix transcriptional regulator [Acetobacteraceae bacterium]
MTELAGAAVNEFAPDDATDASGPIPRVGATIRALRTAKGLTLQDLAASSGVSAGMLSQVERDRANPSLRVLTQIRLALGAPISALFEAAPPPPEDPGFVRRAARRPWLELGYISKELLSPGGPENLQFMILHIPPLGTSGDQPLIYPAEKGGMVLEGELLLTVDGQQARLQEGDSFLFDRDHKHSFRNPNERSARVLWIMGAVAVARNL